MLDVVIGEGAALAPVSEPAGGRLLRNLRLYDSYDDETKAIKEKCEDNCRDEGQESEIGCQIKCYLVG